MMNENDGKFEDETDKADVSINIVLNRQETDEDVSATAESSNSYSLLGKIILSSRPIFSRCSLSSQA